MIQMTPRHRHRMIPVEGVEAQVEVARIRGRSISPLMAAMVTLVMHLLDLLGLDQIFWVLCQKKMCIVERTLH